MTDFNFPANPRDDLLQAFSAEHARDFAATAISQCRHAAECAIARQRPQSASTPPRVCLCDPWGDIQDQS